MKEYNLEDLKEIYNLDLDKVVGLIEESKAKLVLLQFPDGLKQYATSIVDSLEEKTNAGFLIWFGSCFGACDYPIGVENLGIDLSIQIGHSALMPCYLN